MFYLIYTVMPDNSFKIMLDYAKKMAKIESKIKYLESILDSVNIDSSKQELENLLDYRNSPFYTNEEELANDKTILFFKTIIESMPFPVFIKDENGTYQVVNSLEAKLFDVPEEEIIGKNDADFIKSEDELSLIKESDEKVLNTKTAIELPEQNFTTAPEIGILPRDTDRHTLKARSPLCVGGILWPEPMRCVAA